MLIQADRFFDKLFEKALKDSFDGICRNIRISLAVYKEVILEFRYMWE